MFPAKTAVKDGEGNTNVCAACGEAGIVPGRKLCPVCGKTISEGFQPLDAIRSSYHLQRRQLPYADDSGETDVLFERDRNTVADIARACTVYSMMPYLGILFIPLALVFGGFGYRAFRQRPQIGGERSSLICIGASLVLLAVQLLLWWLLYLIPELQI